MKIVVFDTETSGLPSERNASIYETQKWPYILQLSFIIYDTDTNEIEKEYNKYVKINRNLVIINEEASKVHGITYDKLEKEGIDIKHVLTDFNNALIETDICVAHNITFDKLLILVEAIRNNIRFNFKGQYCTMMNGKEVCKIERISPEGKTYYKSPKLIELYTHLFNEEPKNLHDSMADILLCLKCYCKMVFNNDLSLTSRHFRSLYRGNCS
jgi:DNA polymerase III epsilon subunit-like protein